MDHTYNKETLSFYLVAIASALAAIAAMCTSAFWRATGGVAVGFALFLPALVLACFGFSYPSPLNKVRCAAMLGNTLALGVLYICLFIAGDLAGAKIVLYTVAGVFQPNAMGVLLTVFMGFGLLVALMTGARVMMQTFGKSMNDLERKLHVQSTATETENGQAPAVTPRNVDEKQILAKADQEVRMNRMSILPAEEEGTPRAAVTPQEARARTLQREQRTAIRPALESKPVEPAPAEPVSIQPEPAEAEETVVVPVEQPAPIEAKEEAPLRSILDAEEPQEEAVEAEEDDVIYADADDIDDAPTVEVEMAHVEEVPAYDIRTEQTMHRPRQKDASTVNDSLYTDFSYSDKKPIEDD